MIHDGEPGTAESGVPVEKVLVDNLRKLVELASKSTSIPVEIVLSTTWRLEEKATAFLINTVLKGLKC